MQRILAKCLLVVLLWPTLASALNLQSTPSQHACCVRHKAHSSTTRGASFQSLQDSHQCCRWQLGQRVVRSTSFSNVSEAVRLSALVVPPASNQFSSDHADISRGRSPPSIA